MTPTFDANASTGSPLTRSASTNRDQSSRLRRTSISTSAWIAGAGLAVRYAAARGKLAEGRGLSDAYSPAEIERIGKSAAEANEKEQITGLLVASGKLFFQIIEGPEAAIDRLWARISRDPRHRNMLILSEERGALIRLCPDWGMRQVNLDASGHRRDNTLRTILKAIHSQRSVMDELMCTLEESVWHGLLESEASASKAT